MCLFYSHSNSNIYEIINYLLLRIYYIPVFDEFMYVDTSLILTISELTFHVALFQPYRDPYNKRRKGSLFGKASFRPKFDSSHGHNV